MKITWPAVAFFLALLIGVSTWTFNNVLADQANKNSQFEQKFDKIQDQILLISNNVAALSAQLKDINLPNMSASVISIDGRTDRIEKLLNL